MSVHRIYIPSLRIAGFDKIYIIIARRVYITHHRAGDVFIFLIPVHNEKITCFVDAMQF